MNGFSTLRLEKTWAVGAHLPRYACGSTVHHQRRRASLAGAAACSGPGDAQSRPVSSSSFERRKRSSELRDRNSKPAGCREALRKPSPAAARLKTPSISSRRCSRPALHWFRSRTPRYPARLKEIFDPPIVLFARGRLDLLQSVMLGVVGTRRPTAYGIAATERLSPDLGPGRAHHR